jgi:hypothetical protein
VSIALTPEEATNPVDTDHTVTAHVTAGRTPLVGQLVTFSVTGQNSGASGTCVPNGCVTDSSGNVSFTYHGDNGAGDDTIKASFTDAGGALQSATAMKHWVEAPQPPQPLPLTIGSVPDISVTATSKLGATVSYTPPVASDGDDVAPPPVVTCAPASGSLFPIGTTTVTCTATDPDNTPSTPSQVSTSFHVTVVMPTPHRPQCGPRGGHGTKDGHHGDDGKSSGGWSKDTHRSWDSHAHDDDRTESLWDRCVRIWQSWRS